MWERAYVTQRKEAIKQLSDEGGSVWLSIGWSVYINGEEMPSHIPILRQWLGDEAIAVIVLASGASDQNVASASGLFPEAQYCNLPNRDHRKLELFRNFASTALAGAPATSTH